MKFLFIIYIQFLSDRSPSFILWRLYRFKRLFKLKRFWIYILFRLLGLKLLELNKIFHFEIKRLLLHFIICKIRILFQLLQLLLLRRYGNICDYAGCLLSVQIMHTILHIMLFQEFQICADHSCIHCYFSGKTFSVLLF